MGKFILRRFAEALPVLFIVATLTFFLVRLAPGSPFSDERMPAAAREALERHYGLDQPLGVQYLRFLGGAIRGDLGPSLNNPSFGVSELIAQKLPISFELAVYALAIAVCVGLPLGLVAAARPNRWSDHLPMALAMAGICLPSFVLGPLLLLVFAQTLGWFSVAGWSGPADKVLPSLTLGLYFGAYIARLTRASLLDVRPLDYLRTARAKGLPFWKVYLKHALRNALAPVLAYLGPATAALVSGSFVVETIFNVPGLGRYFVTAALDNDYTLVMGTVLVYATLLIAFNLVADIALALLDPRQKLR